MFSTIGVTVLAGGYIVLGAVVFSVIETRAMGQIENTEQVAPTVMNSTMMLADLSTDFKQYIDNRRHTLVEKLWEMTEKMNILYPKNWTREAAEEIMNFQDLLSRKLAVEILSRPKPQSKPIAALPNFGRDRVEKWTFSRALLYSVTLLTTIGRAPILLLINL